MSATLASLCFVALNALLAFSAGEDSHGIILSRYTPTVDMEHQPKCHVRRTFIHLEKGYKMTCFQCNDKDYSIVISHYDTLLLAATVQFCGKHFVLLCVNVVPEYQRKNVDYSIELAYYGKPCKRVNIWPNRKESEEQNCGNAPFYKRHLFRGYVNGWKVKKPSWETGVVRGLVKVTNGMENSCTPLKYWVHERKEYTMKCLDCKTEYMVVIYKNNVAMAAANVGTCRSRRVEDSIDIPKPSKQRPTESRVQYRLNKDQCIVRNYQLSGQSYIEKADERVCPSIAFYSFYAMTGYKNSWKSLKVQ